MRRVILVSLILALGSIGAPAPPAAERDPIVFVHGLLGSPRQFERMAEHFEADGWSRDLIWRFPYDSWRPNEETARLLAALVEHVREATGAPKVDLVTHSMGSLSSRWYLKFLDGTKSVDDWVSLAGPNHGASLAAGCFIGPCLEMRVGSAFLARLNSGDETPGDVAYATFRSPCDEAVSPEETVVLHGALNVRTECLGHNEMLGDRGLYEAVRDFLRN